MFNHRHDCMIAQYDDSSRSTHLTHVIWIESNHLTHKLILSGGYLAGREKYVDQNWKFVSLILLLQLTDSIKPLFNSKWTSERIISLKLNESGPDCQVRCNRSNGMKVDGRTKVNGPSKPGRSLSRTKQTVKGQSRWSSEEKLPFSEISGRSRSMRINQY